MKKSLRTFAYYLHLRRLYGRFFGPRVLIVSVPKSGTHLLIRTLSLFPYLRIGKVSNLQDTKRGHILQTHYPPIPELTTLLEALKFKVLFIVRDPRSTCLSFYHLAVENSEKNGFYGYFAALSDDKTRLKVAISGMEVEKGYNKPVWRGINQEVRTMLPWSNYHDCLTIAFEDLVGARGGGDDEVQAAKLREISHYLGLRLTGKDVNDIAANLFGQTRTFRKGEIDEWRQFFQPEHIALFKKEAGDLLIELGYEQDLNW